MGWGIPPPQRTGVRYVPGVAPVAIPGGTVVPAPPRGAPIRSVVPGCPSCRVGAGLAGGVGRIESVPTVGTACGPLAGRWCLFPFGPAPLARSVGRCRRMPCRGCRRTSARAAVPLCGGRGFLTVGVAMPSVRSAPFHPPGPFSDSRPVRGGPTPGVSDSGRRPRGDGRGCSRCRRSRRSGSRSRGPGRLNHPPPLPVPSATVGRGGRRSSRGWWQYPCGGSATSGCQGAGAGGSVGCPGGPFGADQHGTACTGQYPPSCPNDVPHVQTM